MAGINNPLKNSEYREKLSEIITFLEKWLVEGNVELDQAIGENYIIQNQNVVLQSEAIESIRFRHFENPELPIKGCSRYIAAALLGKLEGLGLVDSGYLVIDNTNNHFALLSKIKIDGEEFETFFDLGRERPVPLAIPVNGETLISHFYNDLSFSTYTISIDSQGMYFSIVEVEKDGSGRAQNVHFEPLRSDLHEAQTIINSIRCCRSVIRAKFDESGKFIFEDRSRSIKGQARLNLHRILNEGEELIVDLYYCH